jgi:lysophospholipase L1-like esterase
VAIVAYGTSMTASGEYLRAAGPALARTYPQARIAFTAVGRNGFDTVLAAFDAQAVAALRPDLVLLELTINDHSPAIRPLIVPALLGIVAQIRAVVPECEFGCVYLARPGDEVSAQPEQIRIHDALAERFGWPSFDLWRLTIDLLLRGEAVYAGPSERALTRDGTHHAPAAARLIGEPFAAALLAAIARSGAPQPPEAASGLVPAEPFRFDADVFGQLLTDRFEFPDRSRVDPVKYVDLVWVPPHSARPARAAATTFQRARRAAPRDFIVAGRWGTGQAARRPANLDSREELLVAVDTGAILRIECGGFACLTGFASGGTIGVRVDGEAHEIRPAVITAADGVQHWPLLITNGLSDRRHVVEVFATGDAMAFSDVFYVQAPAGA